MKVGDYLRLEDGTITRFGGSGFEKIINGHYINCAVEYFHTKKIIKSSPDIIDLIQEGDFINGDQISMVEVSDIDGIKRAFNCEYETVCYTNEMIKSIVTKEQFESMEYKVN